ncbi:MAG: hypothetical protein JWR01_2939 [Subtercola sp.]|nr:hypothetical protein [Subtercola sp.]
MSGLWVRRVGRQRGARGGPSSRTRAIEARTVGRTGLRPTDDRMDAVAETVAREVTAADGTVGGTCPGRASESESESEAESGVGIGRRDARTWRGSAGRWVGRRAAQVLVIQAGEYRVVQRESRKGRSGRRGCCPKIGPEATRLRSPTSGRCRGRRIDHGVVVRMGERGVRD